MTAIRTDNASHWILVDQAAAAAPRDIDRGWRLRVELPDDDGFVDVVEEQVLPERVMRPDANHVRASNGTVRLNLEEARWLRDRLDEVIPELERRQT